MDLTNAQWAVVAGLMRLLVGWVDARGRVGADPRQVLNGIFWHLRTGEWWDNLPSKYPSRQTCIRWYNVWVKSGVLEDVLIELAIDLEIRGRIAIESILTMEPPESSRARGGWRWQTILLLRAVVRDYPDRYERLRELLSVSAGKQDK